MSEKINKAINIQLKSIKMTQAYVVHEHEGGQLTASF